MDFSKAFASIVRVYLAIVRPVRAFDAPFSNTDAILCGRLRTGAGKGIHKGIVPCAPFGAFGRSKAHIQTIISQKKMQFLASLLSLFTLPKTPANFQVPPHPVQSS